MSKSKWWQDYDWRLIQTNLRQIDMADIDAEAFARQLAQFDATVVLLNAAGIIASYPTQLKYHYQSRYLTGDSLNDIITHCHKAGIRVLARTDFSKIRREVYEAHPEWAYRTAEGAIVDYEGDVHACINGGYQQTYAPEIMKECLAAHDFDGIFFNMAGYLVRDYAHRYHGICHCASCQKAFGDMYGLPLPRKEDTADPVYRRYVQFKHTTVTAYNERICRMLRELHPGLLINRDTYTEDTGMIRQECNTGLDRPLPHWQYAGSENTKWVRASYKGFISSNASVDYIDFPTRHTAVSPVQQETRLWQNLANAGQLDYFIIGRLDNHDDTSAYAGVKRVFSHHKRYQALYRDNTSVADVALLTPDHWGSFGANHEAAGLYRMLAESHTLFDSLCLDRLAHIDLTGYKLLILPDVKQIGAEAAERLDRFVEAGGRLLCTGRTGFYDAAGEALDRPALACSGLSGTGIGQDARGAYFQLEAADHAQFPHFDGINLIYIDGDYLYAPRAEGAQPLLHMIPPQPFGPPERCYPLFPAGEHAAAIRMQYGKGLCVTVPWYPGALFHRQGYPNTMHFICDLLSNALDAGPVPTNLPPMAELTLVRIGAEPGGSLIQVVNQTGHFGNSFYPPVTLHTAEAVLPIPAAPVAVRSLITGRDAPYTYADGLLKVQFADIGLYEALHVSTQPR